MITADMLVPVPAIVACASAIMTLNPGDVIFAGALSGVGPITSGPRASERVWRRRGGSARAARLATASSLGRNTREHCHASRGKVLVSRTMLRT